MPKKGKKSIGQSTSKVKKHRISNINIQDSSEENVNGDQNMETTFEISHFGMVTEDEIRKQAIMYEPGISGLRRDNPMDMGSEIEPEREKNSAKVFEDKLSSINKMERKTAKAFQEHGIEDEFEWPALDEDRSDSLIRKHRNQAKLNAARCRQYRNPEDLQLSQERHKRDAELHRQFRNPEDSQLNQQRHKEDAERRRQFRNPGDPQLSQQRHKEDAERRRHFRNPEDPQLSQQRHEEDALRQYSYRISGQISRVRETPIPRRERVQNALEVRNDNRRATQTACKATEILSGEQLITEQNVGSFTTPTGAYENLCEHCKAIRFPKERENICCQHGKVSLPKVPEPTPILKALLEGQNLRSKVFKKYIVPMNNALALASIKIKQSKQFVGNFNPQVIIQGRSYYYIAALEVEEGQQPMFASLYVHDPSLEEAARKNCLFLPPSATAAERRLLDEMLIQLQEELKDNNPSLSGARKIS